MTPPGDDNRVTIWKTGRPFDSRGGRFLWGCCGCWKSFRGRYEGRLEVTSTDRGRRTPDTRSARRPLPAVPPRADGRVWPPRCASRKCCTRSSPSSLTVWHTSSIARSQDGSWMSTVVASTISACGYFPRSACTEIDVPGPPMRGFLAVIVVRHEIAGMRIVLTQRDHDDMRRVLREIPRGRAAQLRVVDGFVPDAFHADVVRRVEPADAVQQGRAALRDQVRLRAEIACGDGGVRIPSVAVRAQIHLRIGLST